MLPLSPLTALTLLIIAPLIAADHPQWGTFRPHALISARAAVPHSPYFGFVYHPANSLSIRHLTTDNHDKVTSFSWSRHDITFGDQTIRDASANLLLTTHFLAHPTHPAACVIRVSAAPLDDTKPVTPISLIFYAVAGPDDLPPEDPSSIDPGQWGTLSFDDAITVTPDGAPQDVRVNGHATSIGGSYTLRVHTPRVGTLTASTISMTDTRPGEGSRSRQRARADKPADISNVSAFHVSSSPVKAASAWAVERVLQRLLSRSKKAASHSDASVLHMLDDSVADSSAGVFVQRLLETPFELDATFVLTDGRGEKEIRTLEDDLTGDSLDVHLGVSRAAFDEKFDRIFRLREKGVTPAEQEFAKTALANVMGGIGFFYGSSIVEQKMSGHSRRTPNIGFLDPVGLLTATPSRASFPRGFLWDEGFHQLVVQRWSPELSQRCMRSWFEASQKSGWIPREQILGLEARTRFPEHVQHLMIQNPLVANPPTILMPLRVLAAMRQSNKSAQTSGEAQCLTRDGACVVEDDSVGEFSNSMFSRAVRYYSWMKDTQSGELLNSFRWRGRTPDVKSPDGYPLTLASGLDDYPRAEFPSEQERHVDLHSWMTWASGTLAQLSQVAGRDAAAYRDEHQRLRKSLIEHHGTPVNGDKVSREQLLLCDYDGDEKICHEGYTTILPLILGLLDPSDARVSAILDSLENPNLLRARAGVRSLSRSDKWHRKGDDYWTGSVWMPFNFLTLAALKSKYSVQEGPYRDRAQKIYKDLKKSILDNSFQVFSKTGQLWENYSPDDDGAGKSGRQFTGWSSLILLIYAEMFDGVA